MFVIHTVYDIRIQIPPVLMSMPTMQAIHNEIDQTYPNRVLMDVGLVICRYGDCLEIGHGVCVPGDNGVGGAYHPCTFRLVVFRPFVEEVCLGRISKSTSEGIHVSLGFFDNIFVPAYWMLRPSRHEESTGLWVWEPDYSDHEDNEQAGGGGGGSSRNDNSKTAAKGDSSDNAEELKQRAVNVKMEDGAEHDAIGARKDSESGNGTGDPGGAGAGAVENGEQANDDNRFEMEIGSEIRFKVKSIHFAQVTTTAKGMQAFVTSTDKQPRGNSGGVGPVGSNSGGGAHLDTASLSSSMSHPPNDRLVRKRSSSVGLDETQKPPSTMKIMASICEDGLGLTSWWAGEAEEEEEEGDDEGGGGGDEGNAGEDHMDEEQEELVVEEEKGMAGEHYKTVMNGI